MSNSLKTKYPLGAVIISMMAASASVSISAFASTTTQNTERSPAAAAVKQANKLANQKVLCTEYNLQGQGPLGGFTGQLQVWSNGKAYRKVQYQNTWQDKFKIEELWEGQMQTRDTARFQVREHLFLSEVNGVTLSKEQFQKKNSVTISLKSLAKQASCSPWTDVQDKRTKNLMKEGYDNPILVKLAKTLFIDSIAKEYRKKDLIKPYSQNPDFKNHRYYTIDDLTDFEFYQQNSDSLRLRNVTANEFTLTEAQLKQSAYAYPLDAKAEIMDRETSTYNINSLGLFHHTIADQHIPDGDSALWTSMYLASQGAKYLTTRDPQAYENLRKSLSGILLLMEVTDNPEEFARGAMPRDGQSVVDSRWQLGKGPYADIYWLPGGNNDMIKGVFLSLIWGYKVIPQNDPLYARMIKAVEKLKTVKLKRLQGLNNAYIAGLDALFNSSQDSYVQFIRSYLSNQNALEGLGLNRQFYLDGIADWSGVNLSTVAALNFYLISDEIVKKWPTLPRSLSEPDQIPDYTRDAQWVRKQQKKTIAQMNEVFKYTKRDFVCLMNYSLNAEAGAAPNKCFLSLIETPVEIPEVSLGFDNRLKEDFTYGATPSLPWKFIGHRENILRDGLENNQMYPKYEADAYTSQMMWKESFSISDRKPQGAHVPRVDYLFTYWTYQMFQKFKGAP